jgi:hypothetical protein
MIYSVNLAIRSMVSVDVVAESIGEAEKVAIKEFVSDSAGRPQTLVGVEVLWVVEHVEKEGV